MTRVAALDCGTNSLRLLVADGNGTSLVDVVRETRIVRLGEGVDRTGRIGAAALERTRAVLTDYAATVDRLGVERLRMVATSATRDAANRDDFTAVVRAVLGVEPEVVTGEQEALLSFTGAGSALPDAHGPLLVADVGGGSTELVRGRSPAARDLQLVSMDVGSVRLTERHVRDDPPSPAQVAAVVGDVRAALDAARARVQLDADVTLVGVAGTVTTVVAIALGLDAYDSSAVHGARIGADAVREVADRLVAMTRAQRLALPVMEPGRADVIAAGALVLATIVDEVGVDALVASEHDILDGVALALLP